jgi:hypothetical protein
MSGNPVTFRGATTLSRAGNLFGVFAVIWMLRAWPWPKSVVGVRSRMQY